MDASLKITFHATWRAFDTWRASSLPPAYVVGTLRKSYLPRKCLKQPSFSETVPTLLMFPRYEVAIRKRRHGVAPR